MKKTFEHSMITPPQAYGDPYKARIRFRFMDPYAMPACTSYQKIEDIIIHADTLPKLLSDIEVVIQS